MNKLRHFGFVLVVLGVMATVVACGPSQLTGSSTCEEFMKATAEQQYNVVSSLAVQYRKPDYTTPLGRPNIPYYCAGSPRTTLDQLFAKL